MARRRAPVEVRRRELLDATVRCLAELGPGGASFRTIAREAGVAPALLQHHFGDRAGLLGAAYRFLSDELAEAGDQALAAAGSDPVLRLVAFAGSGFAPPFVDPGRLGARIARSLVGSVPQLRPLHIELYARYRSQLSDLVTACRPGIDPEPAVAVLSAVLDGLWVEGYAGDLAPDAALRILRSSLALLGLGSVPDRPAAIDPAGAT